MKKGIIPLVGLLFCSLANAGILIDDFSAPDGPLTDAVVGGGGVQGSALGGMVTGERDIYGELIASDGGASTETTIGVGGGRFEFSNTAGETGLGKIQWDGVDAGVITSAFGSGILLDGLYDDYTATGANGFLFDVFFADLGFDFQFNLWTGLGNALTSATFVSAGTAVPVQAFLPFADPAFAGADFTLVNAFELVIDPAGTAVSVDLSLDNIATVPAPGGLVVILAGIGAMLWNRKRSNGSFFSSPKQAAG